MLPPKSIDLLCEQVFGTLYSMLVSRGHTLLKNRKGLVNCPHHFRSLLQNLEEHTFTVFLMGRVRLDNERGRDHKTRALQCFTNFIFNCMLACRFSATG